MVSSSKRTFNIPPRKNLTHQSSNFAAENKRDNTQIPNQEMTMYLYHTKTGLKYSDERPNDCQYIQSHEEKGYIADLAKQVLNIPEEGIVIRVNTNLGYGKSSYMTAKILLNDKAVLNFYDTSMTLQIDRISSKPGEWEALFKTIVKVYENRHTVGDAINMYFDNFDASIGTSDNLLRDINKLSQIVEVLQSSIYTNNVLLKQRVCTSFAKVLNARLGKVQINKLEEVYISKIIQYIASQEMLYNMINETYSLIKAE